MVRSVGEWDAHYAPRFSLLTITPALHYVPLVPSRC
jgi:hypothetical protein